MSRTEKISTSDEHAVGRDKHNWIIYPRRGKPWLTLMTADEFLKLVKKSQS